MRTLHQRAPAVFQILSIVGIFVYGADLAVTRFVHRSLTPSMDDFLFTVKEVAHRWPPRWGRTQHGDRPMPPLSSTGGLMALGLKPVVACAHPSGWIERSRYGLAACSTGRSFNAFPPNDALTALAAACALACVLPAWRIPLFVLALACIAAGRTPQGIAPSGPLSRNTK